MQININAVTEEQAIEAVKKTYARKRELEEENSKIFITKTGFQVKVEADTDGYRLYSRVYKNEVFKSLFWIGDRDAVIKFIELLAKQAGLGVTVSKYVYPLPSLQKPIKVLEKTPDNQGKIDPQHPKLSRFCEDCRGAY